MMEYRDVTLEEVLSFRDEKAACQRRYRLEYPGCMVITFSMNIPGPRKVSPGIRQACLTGKKELERLFGTWQAEILDMTEISSVAGCSFLYAVTGISALELKQKTSELEERHPLGRLFDMDILKPDGVAVSRTEAGFLPRKCLLCEEEAKACGRNRTHTVEELEARVDQIIREGGIYAER